MIKKILVEQSGYPLANLGDVSMLQGVVKRLKELYPDATIEVFTSAPEKLAQFCPQAKPVDLSGRTIWYFPLIGRLVNFFSPEKQKFWWKWEWYLRHNQPRLVAALMQLKLKTRPKETKALKSFFATVDSADLVVASGGGYITDEFSELAATVLGVLGMAQRLGKPTVMLGHGLGPLQNPYLRSFAQSVLPHVNLITLREKRASLPLLQSLGLSSERVLVTGDEAIKLAYSARCQDLGTGIGVNLRLAHYAGVTSQMLSMVRDVVQGFARSKSAQLLPVPISQYDADNNSIKQLLEGYSENSDGGASLDTPIKVIQQIGRCRVVVTGSYHAGVFALSQGIPVIGLAKSVYYQDKFKGLAEQFGAGCTVLLLDDPQLQNNLETEMKQLWKLAPKLKNSLLKSAQEQINLGAQASLGIQKLESLITND